MRKTFLMCRPDFYDVEYVINPWMNNNIHQVNKTLAFDQWTRLYETVSSLAKVELVDAVPNLPDMVFTANAGLPLLDKQYVWLSRFANTQRRPEERYFHAWFYANGLDVIHTKMFGMDVPFEGAGDALVDSNGSYWFGYGQRSAREAVEAIAGFIGRNDVKILELTNPRFYHLDTCFCPLSKGHILWYPDAFSTTSYHLVDATRGEMLIDVDEQDAQHFACNAVDIDGNVILPKCSEKILDALKQRGYNPIVVDLSEFIKAGGAAKCLTLQIR